jgi:diadenosine tetraphosphatase ApaH/serine/threonine PP2A family protein phosphatase
MKIAVLSDIHSNLEALEACLAVAAQQGVTAYACLGDSVNYGADPVATLDRIMALPGLIAVLGNHDEAMFLAPRWSTSSKMEQSAAWTRRQLQPAHLEFLRDLPYVQRAHGAVFGHAALDFPPDWKYVMKPRHAKRCFKAVHGRLLFLGHVHVPRIFRQSSNGIVEEIEPESNRPYTLAAETRYLVNVGSVGQPRDGDNTACFVTYDDAAGELTFQRVPYDYARAAEKIRRAGLHPFYADRLALGQ